MSWNLVVATGWRQERLCLEELYRVGDIVGRRVEEVWFTGFDGLLTAKVEGDPVEFVKMLIDVVKSGYYIPRYILRVTPIMTVVKTDLDEIQKAVGELAERYIAPQESFKIELKKRGVKFDRMSVIEYVARAVNRRVDLTKPDKVVWIEMFPSRTGISVIREDETFSLMRSRSAT
ncbi:THUMP domain-containing protein [Pyrobaculum islandicum]|nr:THUMP domain-containing protein [Pyrobaculum islandicum]